MAFRWHHWAGSRSCSFGAVLHHLLCLEFPLPQTKQTTEERNTPKNPQLTHMQVLFCFVLIWFGFFCLVCWFVFCLVFVFFPSFVFSGVWSCKNHQGKAYTATWSGRISVKLTSHQACSSDGRFWGLCCCVFLCLAPRMWSLVVWQCSGNNEVFSVSGFRITRSITCHPQGDSKGKAKSRASLNSSPPLSGHAFPGPLQAPGCAEHPLETPSGSFHQPGNRQGNRSRADSHGQLNPGQTKRFPPMWSPFLFVYFFSRPVSPP